VAGRHRSRRCGDGHDGGADVSPNAVWGLIIGMAASNLVLRWTPMAFLSRFELPVAVRRWLSYIPVSVMAAIVAVQVLRPDGAFRFDLSNPYLLAALPTAAVYKFTRSFLGSTVTGVLAFLAFRYLLA
jgi:branched-subunit amino acid transport protein